MSSKTDKSSKGRELFRRAANKLGLATLLTTPSGGSSRNKETNQGPQIDATRGVFILTTTMPSMDVNTAASLETCKYTLVQPSGEKGTADQDWIELIDSPQQLSTLWDQIKNPSKPAKPEAKSFQKAIGLKFGVDLDGEDYNGSLTVDVFESSSAAKHSEPGVVIAGDGTISQDTNKPYGEECADSVFGRAVCDSRHRDALMSAEGLSGNVRNEIKTGPRGNLTFNLRPLTASAYQSALASMQRTELIKAEQSEAEAEPAKVKEDQEEDLDALQSDGAEPSQPIDAIEADVATSNTTATIIPASADTCLISSTDAKVIASYTFTPKLAKYDWGAYF